MIAYLVPAGDRRYQLYVEPGEDPEATAAPAEGAGWWSRQVHRFRATLAEAEQERLRRERGEPGTGSGLWKAVLRRMAEAIAEQRLLWHLRHQSSAEVTHPDDMDGAAALDELRAEFSRDVSKHLRWLIINAVIVAITGPLFFLVPGPNIVSWYFTFRAIGHFFSWRGARKGLRDVAWRTTSSAPLTQVRSALRLPAHERRVQLLAIGAELGLRHLAGFVERVAVR
jgi:hypothetical protein